MTQHKAHIDPEAKAVVFVHEERSHGIQGLVPRIRWNGNSAAVIGPESEFISPVECLSEFDGIAARLEIRTVDGANAVALHVAITNRKSHPIFLNEFWCEQAALSRGVSLGAHYQDVRYFHADNVRTERYPYSTVEYPYVRPLPVEARCLGDGENQAFPALGICDREYGRGILFAAASQTLSLPVFRFRKSRHPNPREVPGSDFHEFCIHFDFPQAAGVEVMPGETLELDGLYLELQTETHPQNAIEKYLAYLGSSHRFRGGGSPLRKAAVYCTWNYGRFGDVHADKLLKTAEALKAKLPEVKYFLLDDGYMKAEERSASQSAKNASSGFPAFLQGFYPDPETNVDRSKFPDGMAAFAASLESLGLVPGIWWTPMLTCSSRLVDEHPDWLLRDRDGSYYSVGDDLGYLDIFHPGAASFTESVIQTLTSGWGFKGIKMDFWSHQFEARNVLRRAQGKSTGVRARIALMEMLRRHLPEDGFLMTCCAVGSGDPFLAQWADAFRCGIDIGIGDWARQKLSCEWTLPAIAQSGTRSYLANLDGCGIAADTPLHESIFRATWCYITMGMLEIDGFVEDLTEESCAILSAICARADQGHKVTCLDEAAFVGPCLPRVLSVSFPAGSLPREQGVSESLAFFNWTDREAAMLPPWEHLRRKGRQNYAVRNFWTKEEEVWSDETILRLPARQARLFDLPV